MKSRWYAILSVALFSIFLTACGGSGHTDIQTAPPAVTSLSPAEGPVAGGASVTITGSNFTGTTSVRFGANAAASFAVVSATQITAVSPAGSGTVYVIVDTPAGRSDLNAANQYTYLQPSAEGLWGGTTGSNRAITGLVTHEGDYWLAYSSVSNAATLTGFYSGHGTSISTGTTGGTFNSASLSLREFNFESSGVAASGGTLSSTTYTEKSTFGGSITGFSGTPGVVGTLDSIDVNSSAIGAIPLFLNQQEFLGGGGTVPNSHPANQPIAMTGSLSISGTTISSGSLNFANFGSYVAVSSVSANAIFDTEDQVVTFDGSSAGWSYTATIPPSSCLVSPSGLQTLLCNSLASPTTPDSYHLTDNGGGAFALDLSGHTPSSTLTYHLTFAAALPSVTAGTFTSTYNSLYEVTPTLAAVAGNYTGSAGIGNAMHASALFNIAGDGSVTGTDPTTGCNFSATLAVHSTGGNVYDISALTFTGSGCTYASAGTFTGAARYDGATNQIVVTAISAARNTGFLFVGTKP